MAHSTNDFWAAIDPVANRHFYGMEEDGVEQQFDTLFDVDTDNEPQMSAVEYGGPSNLTLKTENAAITQKQITQGPVKTYYPAVWAGAITISEEAAADVKNRYGKLAQSASALGKAQRVTPDLLTALFLDRAFNSSFAATADGVELCGTHVLPDGITTSANELATPAAMDETAAEDMKTALKGILGPSGNILPSKVVSWVVPSALENIAEKMTRSEKTLGSANNDPSLIKGTKVKVFDYLGSATRWFAETNHKTNGLFWTWITKPKFVTDNVPLNLQKVYIAHFRARYGCVDWRHIYGSAAT